jgi:hypothetical protein
MMVISIASSSKKSVSTILKKAALIMRLFHLTVLKYYSITQVCELFDLAIQVVCAMSLLAPFTSFVVVVPLVCVHVQVYFLPHEVPNTTKEANADK